MAVSRKVLANQAKRRKIFKKFHSVDDVRYATKNGVDVGEMVSRRRILSRSRDDLNMDYNVQQDEDDVWHQKDKLYRDHVQEVLEKWTQIDDEIWAKVICLERNRRVAKAYARVPVLTINGSDDGFDGYRIGMNGFDNPMRDTQVDELKRHIGHGVKIKMDDAGNILVKRVSKANIYIKDITGPDDNCISNDALKLSNSALEMDKAVKIFDMKKFQQNVSKELKRAYPDRRKLEYQCLSALVFVKNETDILDCPCWVMIINIVAMDMLKSKLPPVQRKVSTESRTRSNRVAEEDPYSVPNNGGGSSVAGAISSRDRRSDRPPKLPPRDVSMARYHVPKPDYDEMGDENKYRIPHLQPARKSSTNFPDDPYYCGMRAHIPNFASKSKGGAAQHASPASSESPYGSTTAAVKKWLSPQSSSSALAPQQPIKSVHRTHESPIYDSGHDSEWEHFWDIAPR
jgi:hypothetical protein